MRLSTREVNVQGRLSKSPTQLDWTVLATSAEAWPPLLPSFSKETVEALDRFVQGFICKRIEFRCGQLSAAEYTDSFLPQWATMAEQRTALMEDFFARQGTRLDETTFQRVFGAFERLQSALRDARFECGDAAEDHRDKRITFARPIAHRLIRRSRDRFSLRSVADADDSVESESRLSSSPRRGDVADALRSSLPRTSPSPVPHVGEVLSYADDDDDEGTTVVMPVEESPDGDHFTGRASGVYYGDIFHSVRSSACSTDGEAGPSSVDTVDPPPYREENLYADSANSDRASELFMRATRVYRGPTVRAAAWRRSWILLFYHVVLPISVVWYFFGALLKAAFLP